jgi:hypothetical protein
VSEPDEGRPGQMDIGEYCRRVEEHLTRVNQGHLVRIAGVSFDLVRRWALEGVPLPIVFRGIEQKAERHRAGRSTRPLRLEFCEGDVRTLYDDWRRAVGVSAQANDDADTSSSPVIEERRKPSLTREIDRAQSRLIAAAGRLDTPETLRDAIAAVVEELGAVRELLRHARGDARRSLAARVAGADAAIAAAARRAADMSLAEIEAEAAHELAAYRGRLTAASWQRSLDAAVDRLLRERYGLPVLDVADEAGS